METGLQSRIFDPQDQNAIGNCLCGEINFKGTLKHGAEYGVCHCNMCQHWNGGPGFATEMNAMSIEGAESLSWYNSSDWAERGFCSKCGSNLFYRLKHMPDLYFVMVGTLSAPKALKLTEHIFVDEKPAHYDFADNTPRLTAAEFMARLEGNE